MFCFDAMIGCLVLLLFADASSFDAVRLFAVEPDSAVLILLDVDAVIYFVCLLEAVGVGFVVVVVVVFLPDDVLDELQVEEDVEEDVYVQLDVLLYVLTSDQSC